MRDQGEIAGSFKLVHAPMAAPLAPAAQQLAETLVAPLGRRWTHVLAVAARAVDLCEAVPPNDADLLVAAAWLHDIGYAPEIGHTRFHPLDGARHLQVMGWPAPVVNLVAHHSGARYEAEKRGLAADLAVFPFPDGAVLDALVTADLTTGPSGEHLTYEERIAEILERYAPGHPVHETWKRAAPILAHSIERTELRLQPR
ncbi:HD domain-containing protein [Pseudonocardia sichuanensis]